MEEVSIKDYIQILYKWKLIIIAVAVVFCCASFVVSKFIIKPQYSTQLTLIVGNTNTLNKDKVDINDIMAYNKLVSTYAKIINSRTVLGDALNKLGFRTTTDELNSMIAIMPQQDTQLINIVGKNVDPERAAEIANQVGKSFVNKITEIMKIEQNVHIVDKAIVPKAPVSPNIKLNMIIAFLLGTMLSTGIVFVIEYFDDTIKTTDDIEKYLGLPVIGTIPMVTQEVAAKGGHYNG